MTFFALPSLSKDTKILPTLPSQFNFILEFNSWLYLRPTFPIQNGKKMKISKNIRNKQTYIQLRSHETAAGPVYEAK